ncbi:hypothetical protein GWK47_021114 [Chionoecetes opilio]|uniref:Uncharacterized protein n=1 Tax=Chionoecetes opilio TaxID=41210 RepID=A0A8J4XPD2_CHIOP|nr:hypothetical protein GWK47_021114 [Chionoecetes opilio]
MAAATAARSRSATEVWLLGQPEPNPCWGKQLPKNGQVLRRFFHFVRVQRKSVKEAVSLVTAEVAVGVGESTDPHAEKEPLCGEDPPAVRSGAELGSLTSRIAGVSPLAADGAFSTSGTRTPSPPSKVDEDRQFLLGQRCPDGPRGISKEFDQSLADRERRRLERGC